MPEHLEFQEGNEVPSRRRPSLSPPCEPALGNARIEDYLDHVCAPLVGLAPYARRQEMRAEWRTHLQSLIAAYEELGSGAEEAVEQALQQFGDPRRLGRRWAREWKRAVAASSARQAELPPMARGVLGLTSLSSVALMLAAMGGWVPDPFGDSNWIGPYMLLTMPLSAGLLACFLARVPAARRMLYAFSLLVPLMAALPPIVAAPTPQAWLGFAEIQFTFWVLGAAVGVLDGAWHDLRAQPRGLQMVR